jgi:hypothetical protein
MLRIQAAYGTAYIKEQTEVNYATYLWFLNYKMWLICGYFLFSFGCFGYF